MKTETKVKTRTFAQGIKRKYMRGKVKIVSGLLDDAKALRPRQIKIPAII